MAEEFKQLQAAALFRGDELGAVLSSLGPDGDGCDRLAAVVALLVSGGCNMGGTVRGAFAGAAPVATPMVESTFTSALHACLRQPPVNAVSPAKTSSV